MGQKILCLNCRKSFNLSKDFAYTTPKLCVECGMPVILITHRFRPPGKSDDKKWHLVKYLIENGFRYQHIYEEVEIAGKLKLNNKTVVYPDNLREAKVFVSKYRSQAI